MLGATLGGLHVVSASGAAEALSFAAAAPFSAAVVDLRAADADFGTLPAQLVDSGRVSRVVVIATRASAPAFEGRPGISSVLVVPFATEALTRAVSAAVSGSKPVVETREVSDPRRQGPIGVLLFPDAPDDLPVSGSMRLVNPAEETPDLIVLTRRDSQRRLTMALPYAVAGIVPVVDLSGGNEDIADYQAGDDGAAALPDILARARSTVDRLRSLPPGYLMSEREDDVLLARLYVRNRGIQPAYRPDKKAVAHITDAQIVQNIEAVADRLADAGALKKRFFDRLSTCPACDSARIAVREECRSCRSPNVEEVSIIHHFPCGYQAPERDFVQKNGDLRCPKCVRTLEAFSVDYDRPGVMMICNDCGNETGEPAVGFRCLDCGDKQDASKLKTHTVHAYDLADGVERFVANSVASRPATQPAEHPLARMEAFIRRMEEGDKSFAALIVRIDRDGAVRREHGERAIRGSQHLIERAMREAFVKGIEIVPFNGSLVVLAPDTGADELRSELPDILHFARSALALPLTVEGDVIAGPRVAEIVRKPASRRGQNRV